MLHPDQEKQSPLLSLKGRVKLSGGAGVKAILPQQLPFPLPSLEGSRAPTKSQAHIPRLHLPGLLTNTNIYYYFHYIVPSFTPEGRQFDTELYQMIQGKKEEKIQKDLENSASDCTGLSLKMHRCFSGSTS